MQFRTIAFACAFAALAAPGIAETKKPKSPGTSVQPSTPNPAPMRDEKMTPGVKIDPELGGKKLREELTIDPSVLRRLEPPDRTTELDAVETAYADFKRVRPLVLAAGRRYSNEIRNCSRHSYSPAEQEAAGCQGSDTLDQCSGKIIRHCAIRALTSYQRVLDTAAEKARILRHTVDAVTAAFGR